MDRETKILLISLVFSLILHAGFLWYSQKYTEEKAKELAELRAVELLEENSPKVNPKVKKFIAKQIAKKLKEEGSSEKVKDIEKELSKLDLKLNLNTPKRINLDNEGPKLDLNPSSPTNLPEAEGPQIDLSSSGPELNLDEGGAQIDLSSTADVDLGGADVELDLSGGGKSTAELLQEPPAPAIDLSSSSDVNLGGGGPQMPGGGEGGGRISLSDQGPELSLSGGSGAGAGPPAPPEPKKVIDLNGGPKKKKKRKTLTLSGPLKNRKILRKVRPVYPPEALHEGMMGTCVLKFFVDRNGNVIEPIIVLQSTGYPELDRAAIEALKQWKFAPSNQERQWGILTVIFELQ